METTSHLRRLPMSPRKVALVLTQIRGLPTTKALQLLAHMPQAAAVPTRRLVVSAVANAAHNHGLETSVLVIKRVFVTQGRTLKRMQPRAQGRAFRIRKRTAHITISLSDQGVVPPKKK